MTTITTDEAARLREGLRGFSPSDANMLSGRWNDYGAAFLMEVEAALDLLSAERDALRDMTWFWTIVDRDGLTGLPSSEPEALSVLVTRAAERDALAAECARMRDGIAKALAEIEDAGPKALKYAAQELQAALGARAS